MAKAFTMSDRSQTKGTFLKPTIQGYYRADYHSGNKQKRETSGIIENIITILKNQFEDKPREVLLQVGEKLIAILNSDLPQVLREVAVGDMLVCVIPRAKAPHKPAQLIFKIAARVCVANLDGFVDGIDYIVRHTDTQTTHLSRSGHGGKGKLPYPGITKDTCTISDKLKGKDILLIDDVYTERVNVDEDAIQALFDSGANSVTLLFFG